VEAGNQKKEEEKSEKLESWCERHCEV